MNKKEFHQLAVIMAAASMTQKFATSDPDILENAPKITEYSIGIADALAEAYFGSDEVLDAIQYNLKKHGIDWP